MYHRLGLILLVFLISYILSNMNIKINNENTQLFIMLIVIVLLYIYIHKVPKLEKFMVYDSERSLIGLKEQSDKLRLYQVDDEGIDNLDNVLSQIKENKKDDVRYGDVIYLQSNLIANRFLTGGRGTNMIALNNKDFLVDTETHEDVDRSNDLVRYGTPKNEVIQSYKTKLFLSVVDKQIKFSSNITLSELLIIEKINYNTYYIRLYKNNNYLCIRTDGTIYFNDRKNNDNKMKIEKSGSFYMIKRYNGLGNYITSNGYKIKIHDDMGFGDDSEKFELLTINFGPIHTYDSVTIRLRDADMYLKIGDYYTVESYIPNKRDYDDGIPGNKWEDQLINNIKFKFINYGRNLFLIQSIESKKYLKITSTNIFNLNNDIDDFCKYYIFRQLDNSYLIQSYKKGLYLSIDESLNVSANSSITKSNYFIIAPFSTIQSSSSDKNVSIHSNVNTDLSQDLGGLNQQVFCTNENSNKIQWIIRSNITKNGMRGEIDDRHGQPVLYGDEIYLQTNFIDIRYLGMSASVSNLPFNNNDRPFTINPLFADNYSIKWKICNDMLCDGDDKRVVNYDDLILLSNNIRYLSGARGNEIIKTGKVIDDKYIPGSLNQEVYVENKLADTTGKLFKWIIKKEKGDGEILEVSTSWPLWEYQPGKIGLNNWKNHITASTCRGYEPYYDDRKQPPGSYSSDNVFGEPCRNLNDKNVYDQTKMTTSKDIKHRDGIDSSWRIVRNENGSWTSGLRKSDTGVYGDICQDNSKNTNFVLVNLGNNTKLLKGRLFPGVVYDGLSSYVTEFMVQVAKSNGIFMDAGKFMVNFDYSWIKDNNEISINLGNQYIEYINTGNNKKLILSKVKSYFKIRKFSENRFYLLTQDNYFFYWDNKKQLHFKLLESTLIGPELETMSFTAINKGNKVSLRTFYNYYVSLDNSNYIAYPNQHCGDGLLGTDGLPKHKQMVILEDKRDVYISNSGELIKKPNYKTSLNTLIYAGKDHNYTDTSWYFKSDKDKIELNLSGEYLPFRDPVDGKRKYIEISRYNIIGLKVQGRVDPTALPIEYNDIPNFKVRVSLGNTESDFILSKDNSNVFSGTEISDATPIIYQFKTPMIGNKVIISPAADGFKQKCTMNVEVLVKTHGVYGNNLINDIPNPYDTTNDENECKILCSNDPRCNAFVYGNNKCHWITNYELKNDELPLNEQNYYNDNTTTWDTITNGWSSKDMPHNTSGSCYAHIKNTSSNITVVDHDPTTNEILNIRNKNNDYPTSKYDNHPNYFTKCLKDKSDTECNMYYDFFFGNDTIAQYVKIIPLDSAGLCSLKLSLYSYNNPNEDLVQNLKKTHISNVLASSCYKFNNGKIVEHKDGDTYKESAPQRCTYGEHTPEYLDRFSGGGWKQGENETNTAGTNTVPFLLFDNKTEGMIKGGIIYPMDDDNSPNSFVKSFKVQIAGNNKQFRDVYDGQTMNNEKFRKKQYDTIFSANPHKNEKIKFTINKVARYVKVILTDCNNGDCSLRMDIY